MIEQKLKVRRQRIAKMAHVLKIEFPGANIALLYRNVWELLVAVILSAQCTDKRVNMVTQELFKKYRKLDDYAKADVRAFEKEIKPTGFYRNKAKNILATARILKKDYNGRVPNIMEDLLKLPGVARKTANIILGVGYGKVEGIAVDTHVKRFAIKFDLTDSRDPNKIEQDLMQILPKKEWLSWNHRIVLYGREICPAHRHSCENHPLTRIYPQAAKRWPKARE